MTVPLTGLSLKTLPIPMVRPSSLKVKLPNTGLSSNFSKHKKLAHLILTIADILDFKKVQFEFFFPFSNEHTIYDIETSSMAACKCITP